MGGFTLIYLVHDGGDAKTQESDMPYYYSQCRGRLESRTLRHSFSLFFLEEER